MTSSTSSFQPSKDDTAAAPTSAPDESNTPIEDKEIEASFVTSQTKIPIDTNNPAATQLQTPSQRVKFSEPQIPYRPKTPRRRRTPYAWDDQLRPVYDDDHSRNNKKGVNYGTKRKVADSKRIEVGGEFRGDDKLRGAQEEGDDNA
ncbi:1057_t:CDS:1 [Acaulospora colombiana]|uniref:1057_t:CDS:1 n=1 Tax=Acaulospora colombiana TaxID=27376 RepID=A0ACA9JZU5_9GLOM|nr:1057_t:CDS:1 [Acaulospora colombiana]